MIRFAKLIRDTWQNRALTNVILIVLLLIFGTLLYYFIFSKGFACIKSPLLYGIQGLDEKDYVEDISCVCNMLNKRNNIDFVFTVDPKGFTRGNKVSSKNQPTNLSDMFPWMDAG